MIVRALIAAGAMLAGTLVSSATLPPPRVLDCMPGSGEQAGEFDDADCISAAVRVGAVVSRKGGVLTLGFQGGVPSRRYVDNPRACAANDDDACLSVRLVGYRPLDGVYILRLSYLNSVEFHVVSQAADELAVLDDKPIFSPSGERFGAIEQSDFGGRTRAMSIWRREGGRFVLEFAIPADGPGYYGFRWDGEDRVVLTVQYKGAPREMEIDAILDEGHWLINHAPEHI